MPDRGKTEAEEDPLIELARIVSEDGGFATPKQEKPKMNRNESTQRSSYADGLEAELLQELESSLGGREPPAPPPPPRAATPRPVQTPSSRTAAPPVRPIAEAERDPDDLLRSIEEQLGQFERRQAERMAATTATFAPAPRQPAALEEPELPASEEEEAPEEPIFTSAPFTSAPPAPQEPRRDEWQSRIARLRPLDDDEEPESAPAPAWEPEAEPAPTTRSDYRFRGPANAEWDRPAPEPSDEPRTRRVEGLAGFNADEPSSADLFAPKASRARDIFGEAEPVREPNEESRFSAEGFRRRRIADAFPEFEDEAPTAAASADDERATINARLAEALESDYAGKEWESAAAEEAADEPKVAAAVAAGASRRAAAARAQAAQRSKGMRTAFVTAVGVIIVVVIGGAAALYLRSTESGPATPPPIITADEGPVKVETPQATAEGETVGEAVYNRVAGNAPATEEQVVDSAEEPREVARIVLPQSQTEGTDTVVRPVGEDPAAEAAPADVAVPNGEIGPRRVPTFTVRPDGTIVANSAAEGEAATPAAEPPAEQQVATAETAAPAELPSADEAIGAATEAPLTPRPTIEEPTELAAVAPLAQPAAPQSPVNLLPGAAPAAAAGGYLVQVSSERSMDQAQSSYAAAQTRFPSVLGSLSPVIQEADLGAKGIYYRVRVGPWASRDDAIQVCESLKAVGGNCFVTQ